MIEDMVSFGEFIRYWRLKRKLSQEEIAKKLGGGRANFSRIENNRMLINEDRLETLAQILEINPKQVRLQFYIEYVFKMIEKSEQQEIVLDLVRKRLKQSSY